MVLFRCASFLVNFLKRVKLRADVLRVSTVSDNLRYIYMRVTIDVIEGLEALSESTSFKSVRKASSSSRSAFRLRSCTLGRACTRITFYLSLAYSPLKCNGCPPSVQVLSQAMVERMRFIRRNPDNPDEYTNITDYVANFVMMLRCSYVCARVGVAFLDVAIVHVTGILKRIRRSSFFSE
jgi:hypothetical protein